MEVQSTTLKLFGQRQDVKTAFRLFHSQMNATDDEKSEAVADVDDEFARRQQQMETAIIQVKLAGRECLPAHRVVQRAVNDRLVVATVRACA